MTDAGCEDCAENTYSGDAAEDCTACDDGKISAAGSSSEDACYWGKSEYAKQQIKLISVF